MQFPACPPVQIKHWIEVDGNKFVKIAKSDCSVVRLLTGQGVGSYRALARTDIVECLIARRNAKLDELLNESLHDTHQAQEDLGVEVENPRHKSKRMRRYAGALPEIVEIEAPGLEGLQPIQMNVLRQRPDQPLWVELVPENLDYLRAYVLAQINAGNVKQPAPGENRSENEPKPPASGVIWARDRDAFRARFKDETGTRRTKDFKQSSLAAAFRMGVQPALAAGEAAMPLQNGDGIEGRFDASVEGGF